MMTNAQKYEEVFGFPPDKVGCPTKECDRCPCNRIDIYTCASERWWDSEYKELEV